MRKNQTLIALTLATMLVLVGMPRLGLGQETNELEKLKSTVKTMEQTLQEMNRKIADLEKQPKAAPTPLQPVPLEQVTPGVPPSTHPGADVKPKVQPPADELADDTTQIR